MFIQRSSIKINPRVFFLRKCVRTAEKNYGCGQKKQKALALGYLPSGQEFKMVEYADDLTVFMSNVERAQLIFQLLDQFRSCSGLKVIYTKTEAMWTATPLGIVFTVM